jgi:murein L,D-transpeptidase YcbB/YkuD
MTTHDGRAATSGEISDEVLAQGKLAVRQKPGPINALGLVRLIFPNEYSVCLHSTHAPFSKNIHGVAVDLQGGGPIRAVTERV